jgi:hypothetical protein
MTDRELELQLRAWYRARADQSMTAPAELAASVLAIPDEEPVRPEFFGSRRTLLLMAAALLLALVVGTAVAIGEGLLPWLDDDGTPELGLPASWQGQQLTDLRAGTYYLDLPTAHTVPTPTIRVTFTLPEGFERVEVVHLLWGQDKWLDFGVFENLWVDPCDPGRGVRDPAVGRTVAEIADALTTVPGWTVTSTSDVNVDGYPGKRVDLIAPADTTDCFDESSFLLRVFGTPNFLASLRPSEAVQIWIMDVAGTPLVIRAGSEPPANPQHLAALKGVIDSIQIGPPTTP